VTPAVAAILEGMPEPGDLRLHHVDGRCVVTAGSRVLFDFAAGDVVMRNLAISALRQLGFAGRRVAGLFGLTENYVATLHRAALREGSAALVRRAGPGRPGKLADADWERAAAWRAAGVSDAEIGRRLGVANTTVGRRLGPRPEGAQPPLPEPEPREPGGAGGRGGEPAPAAGARPAGEVACRYAGAMLLHGFAGHAGAGQVLEAAAGSAQDAALLAAASMCFALGAATAEQFKHLVPAGAGALAGLARLPDLRTLRPKLAAIADRTDPLELQALFARAMLEADPVLSGVYYVDDHFVPYTGAKPVAKGWSNKRGRAEKGRADTHVTAHDGRAVCFVTGEPSGLTVSLPQALAELKKAVPEGAKIMLGFDRGGACAQVFRHCREQEVHWVTWRRAPLAVPARLPVLTQITVSGKAREVTWADEQVQLKDYGDARQLTLFERGAPALQALTSDQDACPAQLLSFLRSRWREENFLKYAEDNYGIGRICDYAAAIEANTKMTDNPARKAANTAVRRAENALAAAREGYAVMLADPAIPAPAKNTSLIPAAQRKITRAEKDAAAATAARDHIPAKLPANQIDPEAQVALLRAGRRGLQMTLRLLAHNAEHWLATQLNAYLQDDNEYRAITRQTIIRGLAGTITYQPASVTVRLDPPSAPRVARALALLLDQLNTDPPAMPGDLRPISYQLAAPTSAFKS